MPILHHVLSMRLIVAGAAVCAAGGAAAFKAITGQAPASAPAMMVAGPAWARPPVVPAGDADLSTEWVPTTSSKVSVLFSYHRTGSGCAGPCERFGLALHFVEPASLAAPPSALWQQISAADCAFFLLDGTPDQVCAGGYPMSGRDQRGNDYVLLQMYATRAQLARMVDARTLSFRLARVSFDLSPSARVALRDFLGSAGRGTPQ